MEERRRFCRKTPVEQHFKLTLHAERQRIPSTSGGICSSNSQITATVYLWMKLAVRDAANLWFIQLIFYRGIIKGIQHPGCLTNILRSRACTAGPLSIVPRVVNVYRRWHYLLHPSAAFTCLIYSRNAWISWLKCPWIYTDTLDEPLRMVFITHDIYLVAMACVGLAASFPVFHIYFLYLILVKRLSFSGGCFKVVSYKAFASIWCGSTTQKRALLSATHEYFAFVFFSKIGIV